MRGYSERVAAVGAVCMLLIMTQCENATGNKFEKEFEKEKEAIKLTLETQRGGYGIISTEALKKLVDARADMIIIDAMPYEDSCKKAHISGAKQFLFPVTEMSEWDTKETGGKTNEDYATLLGPYKGKKIVAYCGFVKCGRSHNAAA